MFEALDLLQTPTLIRVKNQNENITKTLRFLLEHTSKKKTEPKILKELEAFLTQHQNEREEKKRLHYIY